MFRNKYSFLRKKPAQTFIFVWVGGPIPEALLEKFKKLIPEIKTIYLFVDKQFIKKDQLKPFEESLQKAQNLGVNIIDISFDNPINLFTELASDNIPKNVITLLMRGYSYHLYGHDYYTDQNTSVNKYHQNLAAAADIIRLLGLRSLQKQVNPSLFTKQYYLIYLDHDVYPLEKLMFDPEIDYQLHKIKGSIVAPVIDKPVQIINDGGLNNAVIRIHYQSDICLKALRLIADRHFNFLRASASIQSLATLKHSESMDLRLRCTFYLTGPHIFETLIHAGELKFDERNVLEGKEIKSSEEKNEQEEEKPEQDISLQIDKDKTYHFTNESSRSWLGTISCEHTTYSNDAKDELLYLIGLYIAKFSIFLHIDEVNEVPLDIQLNLIREELLTLGLPSPQANMYDPAELNHTMKVKRLSACLSVKDITLLLDNLRPHLPYNPVSIILKLFNDDFALTFAALSKLNLIIEDSANLMLTRYDSVDEMVLATYAMLIKLFDKKLESKSVNELQKVVMLLQQLPHDAQLDIMTCIQETYRNKPELLICLYLHLLNSKIDNGRFHTEVLTQFTQILQRNNASQIGGAKKILANVKMLIKDDENLLKLFNKLTEQSQPKTVKTLPIPHLFAKHELTQIDLPNKPATGTPIASFTKKENLNKAV